MIIFIAAVSAGVAYFVANSLLGGVTEKGVKVKTIDPITSVVESPDPTIFNANAINPSVEVNINNTAPDTTTNTPETTTTNTPDTTNKTSPDSTQ